MLSTFLYAHWPSGYSFVASMCFKFLPICMFIIHMHTFFIFSGYGLMLKFCTVNSFLICCLAVHFHNDILQYTDIPNFNKAQLVLFSSYRLIFCVCVCSVEKPLPTSRHGHVFHLGPYSTSLQYLW